MTGAFKLDHVQPFEPILSQNIFNFFTLMLGGQFLLPQRANNGKGEFIQPQNWMRQRGFSPWGIQTGTVAVHWAHFVPNDFQLFHFHAGRPILITPEGQFLEKGNPPTPKVNETEGFQCVGHSNWTICIPLSPFCSKTFQSFSLSYWEANSYYPRGPIMGEGISSNLKSEWDRGISVPGAFKLDHLHPIKHLLF